jgi:CheY-like chemotaxis protein
MCTKHSRRRRTVLLQESEPVLNVLAVEDNPADVYLLREAFQTCGRNCALTVVNSQAEAWAVLERGGLDLLISNVGSQLSDIVPFVRKIRSHEKLKGLPIVLLSGSFEVTAAYEAGVNAFIRKGVDVDTFFEKIKGLVHFWVEVAERPVLPSAAQKEEGASAAGSSL